MSLSTLLSSFFGFPKPRKKRVFISFSIEDIRYRDFLVDQKRNKKSPFDFMDMSAKKPWKTQEWKKHCRSKIKGCCGMIVLIGENTYGSSGVLYEIWAAKQEGVPMIGIPIKKSQRVVIPNGIAKGNIYDWSWENISGFIDRL